MNKLLVPVFVAAITAMWLLASLPVWAGSLGGSQPPLLGASTTGEGATQFKALALDSQASDITAAAGSPCVWYNSTRKALRLRTAAGVTSVAQLIDPPVTSSSTLNNPQSATAFDSKQTIPANALTAGRVVTITAWGKYTSGSTVFPTVTLGTKIGATVVGSTGAITAAINLTDKAWLITSRAVVRTAGASGTLVGFTRGEVGGLLAATLPVGQVGRASTSIDTTVDNDVVATALFGVSDAANAITCEGLLVE